VPDARTDQVQPDDREEDGSSARWLKNLLDMKTTGTLVLGWCSWRNTFE
jgi:hypothetical protein